MSGRDEETKGRPRGEDETDERADTELRSDMPPPPDRGDLADRPPMTITDPRNADWLGESRKTRGASGDSGDGGDGPGPDGSGGGAETETQEYMAEKRRRVKSDESGVELSASSLSTVERWERQHQTNLAAVAATVETTDLASWEEGDIVDYGDGSIGVITSKMTSDFTWPQHGDDDIEVEASSDDPKYVVARESGGSAVYSGDELSEGSLGGDDVNPDDVEGVELAGGYRHVPDPLEPFDRTDLLNIPGVDDPEVGFAAGNWPNGWDRTSLMKFWATVGGTWTSCQRRMADDFGEQGSKRFCAAAKDELLGTENWRNRF